MSCSDCDTAVESGMGVYPYRWTNAIVTLTACRRHATEIIHTLSAIQSAELPRVLGAVHAIRDHYDPDFEPLPSYYTFFKHADGRITLTPVTAEEAIEKGTRHAALP